jgi:hypothetical protein
LLLGVMMWSVYCVQNTLAALKSMPADLSKGDCASLKQDVCKACEEFLVLNKQALQQHIQHADREVLQQAVQQGLTTFQARVDHLAGCSDPGIVKEVCSVSLIQPGLVGYLSA